jgi:hypothetical protein
MSVWMFKISILKKEILIHRHNLNTAANGNRQKSSMNRLRLRVKKQFHMMWSSRDMDQLSPTLLLMIKKQDTALSMRWTALDPSTELEAVMKFDTAKNWDEFKQALTYSRHLPKLCVCLKGWNHSLPGKWANTNSETRRRHDSKA